LKGKAADGRNESGHFSQLLLGLPQLSLGYRIDPYLQNVTSSTTTYPVLIRCRTWVKNAAFAVKICDESRVAIFIPGNAKTSARGSFEIRQAA
jgi:hypothetical protein